MIARNVTVMLDPACEHSEWHSEIIKGIQKSAAAAQRTVQVMDLPGEDFTDHDALADPVILSGFSLDTLMTAIRRLAACKKRVVLAGIDADSLSSQVSCVTHSRSRQTMLLIRYLRGCGRERIALLGIGENSLNDLVKVSTATRYTAALPNPIRQRDVFTWNIRLAECLDAFFPVVQEYNAVICPNDYVALLAMNELKRGGVRVPEDLYLISFSNLAISRFCQPAITTITMDFAAIGRYAFAIWQQLQALGDAELVCRIIAPSRLLIRGSTAFQEPSPAEEASQLWEEAPQDFFYHEPSIQNLMQIERCLNRHDELDLKIIEGLLQRQSYEALTDALYISSGALHYRLSKLYRDMDCHTRKEFEAKMQDVYGEFVRAQERP